MSTRNQTPESYKKLFETILDEIPEFDKAIKTTGKYMRSSIADNGFEFVVFPKNDEKVHFEYIARKNLTDEHFRHATFVRDNLNMGGANSKTFAKVDYYDSDLSVSDVDEVIESLKEFLRNTTVTVAADKMLQLALN